VARLSPNGEWVASGDVSGRVRVWGLNEDYTLKAEHQPLSGAIDDIAWSDDGQRIVASGDGRGNAFAKVFMWDAGTTVGEITGMTKRVNSVDFKPGRPYRIATGSEDFTVSFFSGPPFKFTHTLHAHGNYVNCVRFSPDGSRFASVGSDGKGKIFDGTTGVQVADLPGGKMGEGGGHAGTIYACSWSPDGTKLLTCGADKTCRLWEVPATVSAPRAAEAPETSPLSPLIKCVKLTTFTFSTGKQTVEHMQVGCLFVGERMISLSLNGDLNILDIDNPAMPKAILTGHPKCISSLTVSNIANISEVDQSCAASPVPGTRHVYSASLSALPGGDNVVCRWTPGSGCDLRLGGEKHTSEVRAMTAKGGGDLLSVGLDDACRKAPLTDGGDLPLVGGLQLSGAQPMSGGGAGAIAYVADGLKLSSQPQDVDASADGSLAVVATLGGVVLVSAPSMAVLCETPLEAGDQRTEGLCAAMRPDAGEVAVGCRDGKVRVFAVHSGGRSLVPGPVLEHHRGEVTAARYSPDGSMLATCDANREVVVWTLIGGAGSIKMDKMVFHKARVTCLSWCPDGVRLATGSLDANVIIWDTGKCALEHVKIEGAHQGGVTALEWRDCQTLCTGGFDACVRTWTANP
jgi:WD40 repeat protein